MTPERLREIIAALDRKYVSGLLGFKSDNSLRQCEDGDQALEQEKALWLERYHAFREKQEKAHAQWLEQNKPEGWEFTVVKKKRRA